MTPNAELLSPSLEARSKSKEGYSKAFRPLKLWLLISMIAYGWLTLRSNSSVMRSKVEGWADKVYNGP